MKTVNKTNENGIFGKHYHTLVVSKLTNTVFCLGDMYSQASEERWLIDRILMANRVNFNKLFKLYPCGNTINLSVLPKKYQKYQFVETLDAFQLEDGIVDLNY